MSTRHQEHLYKLSFGELKKLLEAANLQVAESPSYRLGAFEVVMGEWLVYSKLRTGRLPNPADIAARIQQVVGNPEERELARLPQSAKTTMDSTVSRRSNGIRKPSRSSSNLANTAASGFTRSDKQTASVVAYRSTKFFSPRKINTSKYVEHYRPELLAALRRCRPQSAMSQHIKTEPTFHRAKPLYNNGMGVSKAQMSSSLLQLLSNTADLPTSRGNRLRTSEL